MALLDCGTAQLIKPVTLSVGQWAAATNVLTLLGRLSQSVRSVETEPQRDLYPEECALSL